MRKQEVLRYVEEAKEIKIIADKEWSIEKNSNEIFVRHKTSGIKWNDFEHEAEAVNFYTIGVACLQVMNQDKKINFTII